MGVPRRIRRRQTAGRKRGTVNRKGGWSRWSSVKSGCCVQGQAHKPASIVQCRPKTLACDVPIHKPTIGPYRRCVSPCQLA